ncbi:MAG: TonB-dependent receptor [Campylobacteraceae bacterium]|nr:TonB-dependent receptor [Campylobacteraceae bacterium]
MKKKLYISAVAAALCLGDLYAKSSVETIETIEVIEAAEIEQSSRVSDTIDEEFTREIGANSIGEALQQIPGIVNTYGEDGGTKGGVNIRGFGGTRVPVFVDGIPVYSPYDKSVDVARINTFDISEIIVSKGYTSSLLGSNSLGGAINIVSKRPSEQIEGSVGAGITNGKGYEESLSIGTGQDTYYIALSVLNTQREYYNLPHDYTPNGNQKDYGRKRENAKNKDLQVNFKVGLTPNDTDEYSINYIKQDGEKGQPFAANDVVTSSVDKWYWKDLDRISYYVLTKTYFDNFAVNSRWYYDRFYNFINNYGSENYNLSDKEQTHEYNDSSYGGIVEGSFRLSDDKMFKVSLSKKFDTHKYNIENFAYNPNPYTAQERVNGDTLSVGIEHIWKFNEQFTWVVGGAYDRNKITKIESDIPLPWKNWPDINDSELKEISAFSPQTILYFQPNNDLLVYGSVSKKNNIPSIRQRYSPENWQVVPNPALEAEEALNYEVGAEYIYNNSHVAKAAVFYAQTDNFIVLENGYDYGDPTANPPRQPLGYIVQYKNAGEEKHTGFEASLNSYWNDMFSTTVSYTYIDTKIVDKGDLVNPYVTDVPKHNLYASAKFTVLNKVNILPTVRYESERYSSFGTNEKNKGFTVADIRVIYRPIDDLEISAGVKNIFDKYYYYDIAYPQEGRGYYANVRYSF